MSRRFVICAAWAAVSSVLPSVLYAEQQMCEKLVAVNYLDPSLTAASALDPEMQYTFNADFLKALAQKAQLNISLESAQGAKALDDVRSGRVDLIIAVSQQTAVDAQLDYLKPAYTQQNYRLWRRAGEQLSLQKWPELAGLRGLQTLDTQQLGDFNKQVKLRHWPMRSVDTLEMAVERIVQGRADYVLAEQATFQQLLAEKELTGYFEFLEPPVANQQLFLAIAKDSACNSAELRATLSKAMVQLHAR